MRDYGALLLHLVVWSSQLIFLPVAMIFLIAVLHVFFWGILTGVISLPVALYTIAELRDRGKPKRGKWEVTD